MPNSNEKRRKHFVDAAVQGAILRQALVYWLYGLLTYTGVICMFQVIPHWMSGEALDAVVLWHFFAPMIISSAACLPIVMVKSIRFSNRFVGPMVRFRNSLKQLVCGERMDPIKLRSNDFWVDIAADLNLLAKRLPEVSVEAPEREESLAS